MTTWQSLHKKFNALGEETGRGKLNSFYLSVIFGPADSVLVTMGTADIPGWGRVTHLGPFACENLALDSVRSKIDEAVIAIKTP